MAKKTPTPPPVRRPHDVDDGKFRNKEWAKKNPGKVEWVKDKPKK